MSELWSAYMAYFWAKLHFSILIWTYLLPVLLGLLVLYVLYQLVLWRR